MTKPETQSGPVQRPGFEFSVCTLNQVPATSAPWVTLRTSATTEIASSTGIKPNVQIFFTGSGVANDPELRGLPKTECYVREIGLYAADQLCLIGRTTTPFGSDTHAKLANLGTRPLADLLFAEADSCVLETTQPLVSKHGWYGRNTLWQVAGCAEPLQLLELFNPEFTQRYQPISPADGSQ